MTVNRVSFTTTDYPYPHLEPTAEKIADFLLIHSSKFREYCRFLRTSSTWTKNNYRNYIQSWESSIRGKRRPVAQDSTDFIALINEFFAVCNNDNDIKKMRGLVSEKLLERIFKSRYSQKTTYNNGYGAVVSIDGVPVLYRPTTTFRTATDCDERRQTVDIGFWDGQIGEFVEIKSSPNSFQTKDINYLRMLVSCLEKATLEHDIFLITLDDKDQTQTRLTELSLWSPGEFNLIGKDEMFSMQTA